MNYTSQKLKCKPLIGVLFCAVLTLLSIRFAYAYDRVYIYASGDFGMSGGFIPELANIKQTYVLNVSPRAVGELHSVTLSYDSLSDLVYYCNEHGLSTTLTYNNANGVYLAYVADKEFKLSAGKTANIRGCLGNSDGYVYVAEGNSSGGDISTGDITINNNTVINNRYIGDFVGSASKVVSDVNSGLKNIIDWLDLQVDATLLVVKQVDLTNDLLYWIADNFNDLLYIIARTNLLATDVAINQWETLTHIEDGLIVMLFRLPHLPSPARTWTIWPLRLLSIPMLSASSRMLPVSIIGKPT